MRKLDRALKQKGYRQVGVERGNAILTESNLKDRKGDIVRVIRRAWIK